MPILRGSQNTGQACQGGELHTVSGLRLVASVTDRIVYRPPAYRSTPIRSRSEFRLMRTSADHFTLPSEQLGERQHV